MATEDKFAQSIKQADTA